MSCFINDTKIIVEEEEEEGDSLSEGLAKCSSPKMNPYSFIVAIP